MIFVVDSFAAIGDCSPLDFVEDSFLFNDGQPVAITDNGYFCVSAGCFGAIGDVDTDGNAQEAWDALQIVRSISGIPTIYDPIPICVADTNCSGTISLIDPVLILQRSVQLIDGYCQPSSSKAASSFEVSMPSLTVSPGSDFELILSLDQLPSDPCYGYSLDMSYDPDVLSFSGVTNHENTLSERWTSPVVNSTLGQLTLTQINPYTSIETTGQLLKITGSSGFEEATTSVTLTRFTLAANSEPEQVFGPFTISVQGTLCFDLQVYQSELATWGSQPNPNVQDLIQRVFCL